MKLEQMKRREVKIIQMFRRSSKSTRFLHRWKRDRAERRGGEIDEEVVKRG